MITQPRISSYYPNLDGWRGYAILWIMLGHVVFIYSINYAEHPFLLVANNGAALIVDIFFIVSGYVITEKLFSEEQRVDLKAFFIKRALKVLPIYFGIVLLAIIVQIFVPNYRIDIHNAFPARSLNCTEIGRTLYTQTDAIPPVEQSGFILIKHKAAPFWPNLVLVQNYYRFGDRVKLLEHTWFVAMIVHFYLIYGFLTFLVYRFFNGREKRRNAMLCILMMLTISVVFLRTAFGTSYYEYFQMTHFRLDAILLGCILNLGGHLFPSTFTKPPWTRIVPPLLFGTGLIILVTLIFRWPVIDQYQFPSQFAMSYCAFGLMIKSTMGEERIYKLIFGNPAITWIGHYSYGIYLWHYPFMFFYRLLAIRMQWSNTFSLTTFCMLSIIIGAGLQHLFEKAPGLSKSVIASFSR